MKQSIRLLSLMFFGYIAFLFVFTIQEYEWAIALDYLKYIVLFFIGLPLTVLLIISSIRETRTKYKIIQIVLCHVTVFVTGAVAATPLIAPQQSIVWQKFFSSTLIWQVSPDQQLERLKGLECGQIKALYENEIPRYYHEQGWGVAFLNLHKSRGSTNARSMDTTALLSLVKVEQKQCDLGLPIAELAAYAFDTLQNGALANALLGLGNGKSKTSDPRANALMYSYRSFGRIDLDLLALSAILDQTDKIEVLWKKAYRKPDTLDLSGMGICRLPDTIPVFDKIRSIVIANNQLDTSIPLPAGWEQILTSGWQSKQKRNHAQCFERHSTQLSLLDYFKQHPWASKTYKQLNGKKQSKYNRVVPWVTPIWDVQDRNAEPRTYLPANSTVTLLQDGPQGLCQIKTANQFLPTELRLIDGFVPCMSLAPVAEDYSADFDDYEQFRTFFQANAIEFMNTIYHFEKSGWKFEAACRAVSFGVAIVDTGKSIQPFTHQALGSNLSKVQQKWSQALRKSYFSSPTQIMEDPNDLNRLIEFFRSNGIPIKLGFQTSVNSETNDLRCGISALDLRPIDANELNVFALHLVSQDEQNGERFELGRVNLTSIPSPWSISEDGFLSYVSQGSRIFTMLLRDSLDVERIQLRQIGDSQDEGERVRLVDLDGDGIDDLYLEGYHTGTVNISGKAYGL